MSQSPLSGQTLPVSSDPYQRCFVLVAEALQGQKGRKVARALRAVAEARSVAITEYSEILAIAQVLQDALMQAERRHPAGPANPYMLEARYEAQ